MLSSIFTVMATNAAVGWVGRRLGEFASLLAVIVPVFLSLPPAYQDAFFEILRGNGGELSIATYFGIISYIISQWRSYRATVTPQVVAPQGKRRELTDAEALALNNAQTGLNQTHIPTRNH